MSLIFLTLISILVTYASADVLDLNVNNPCYTPNTCPPLCNARGVCVNSSQTDWIPKCHCYKDYAKDDCSYTRKKQATAFGLCWLGIIGILGIDRFYLGYTCLGFLFLLIGLGVFILSYITCCLAGGAVLSDRGELTLVYMIIFYITVILCIFIYELVVTGSNSLHDAHGYKMSSW